MTTRGVRDGTNEATFNAAGSPIVSGQEARPGRTAVFDLRIEIDAYPFSGLLETIVTADDLALFKSSLQSMQVPGRVLLGGDRTVLLSFDVEAQNGGNGDRLGLEVTAAPSEDDPWPKLSFLIFDVSRTFAATAAHSIETFLSDTAEAIH